MSRGKNAVRGTDLSDAPSKTINELRTELPDIRDAVVDEETGEVLMVASTPPFFKTPWNHNTDAEALRTSLACADPSKAQQHQKEEADINNIVEKFLKTGEVSVARMPPSSADFEDVGDFQDALNTVKAAEEAFMRLPAKARAALNHDPAEFIDLVDNSIATGDMTRLKELGLTLPKPPTPEGGTPAPSGGQGGS